GRVMVGERAYQLTAKVADAARAGASYLADLVARLVDKALVIGTAVLALGTAACDGESDAKVAPAAKVVQVAPAPIEPAPPRETGPIGKFDITFYYVTSEEEVEAKIAKQQA